MTLALAAPELPDDPGDGSWGEMSPIAPVLTASSPKLLAMSTSMLPFRDSPALLDALEVGTEEAVVFKFETNCC